MPQLTPNEQDEVLKLAAQSKKPPFIHTKIAALRRRRRADPVDITTIRRFMRSKNIDEVQSRLEVESVVGVMLTN